MGLEPLELLIWVEIWVFVVEADDESDMDLVFIHVVHETTAVGFGIERPVYSMHDQTIFKKGVIDLPDFFETESVLLR